MKFQFQNKEYNFPASLSDISLGQRIDFNDLYGKEMMEKQNTIDSTDEVYLLENHLEMACKSFSFFSGIALDEVFKIPMNQVLNVFENCLKSLLEQQGEMELTVEFFWNDAIWIIEQPKLNYQSEMTFNEFLTSKQIVKSMVDLGNGQWEVLPYLCAIFLKKENEAFDEAWLSEDNERIELMKSLPLDIALQVGFFLSSSMNLFLKTFQSLEAVQEEKDPI
jgi:hypothetical protein